MATLRDVRRRILSVKNTQKLTRAMKMVASARLRKAERLLLMARPYSDKMMEVLSSLALRATGGPRPLLESNNSGKVEIVVITGDKGLCGAFNSNILRFTLSSVANMRGKEVSFFLVGKKARDFFKRRPEYHVRDAYVGFWREFAFRDASTIAQNLVKEYLDSGLEATYLVYNEFKSALVQRVTIEQLIPIVPMQPQEGEHIVDYIYEPSASAVLEELLRRHIDIQVYRALVESFASEQGARMTAMDAATDNAEDMIERLTLEYHRARQSSITKEIIEIVSGAEALAG